MAKRFETITELYRKVQAEVANPREWQKFLASACRNYRLPFDEQLLVYAQRPDATAVLEIERWNRRFGRWVNRGATGIAVFSGEGNRLKYYFDISDTHEGRNSRPVPVWTIQPEDHDEILESLENSFGELERNSFASGLLSAVKNAVEDNLPDYLSELSTCTQGSFLEELDGANLETVYQTLVRNSVGYLLLSRCGLDPRGYFADEDFQEISQFNTPQTLNALGVAAGDIGQLYLSEIARTVLHRQRENRTLAKSGQIGYPVSEKENTQTKRSFEDERDYIHEEGRLQPSEPSTAPGTGDSPWEIRDAAETLSYGAPQDHLHESADQREALQPSGGDPADSPAPDGADHSADGQRPGRDGGTEGRQSNGVGAEDEQHPERGGGNRAGGTDLQLNEENAGVLETELPAFLDEKQIMAVIANKDDDLNYKKSQIELFFSIHTDEQERAEYLKSAYPDRYTEIIADGQRLGYKPQENGLLMWEGSYPSRTKESVFSWEVVAGWTAQLIDKKEYFIQTDIPKLSDQESQQMSLFSFREDNSAPVFPALSQQVIDEALCLGSNEPNSRLVICAYFMKDKPLEDNSKFLMEHYGENGAGFYLNGQPYAIWYNAEGIRIGEGVTANRPTSTLITWEQAAKRVRELLDLGRYMPQSELDRVSDYERQQRAAQLWYLRQDFEEGTADAGYLSTVNAIYNTHRGFPEESAAIQGLLNHPEALQTIRDELEQFVQAYGENRELLRFHFHRPQKLLEQLSDLQREPLSFTANQDYDPQRRFFISDDEIDDILRSGGKDYRLAVYSFFQNQPDPKERETFLKRYHGEYNGRYAGNDSLTYTYQKITFSHGNIMEPYAKTELSWSQAVKRISAMIAQGRFLDAEDRTSLNVQKQPEQAGDVKADTGQAKPFTSQPRELLHPLFQDDAERMGSRYQVVVYHHTENGFDERLDYQTLAEAEQAAQKYVAGTMEGEDGFAYDGAAVYDLKESRWLRVYGEFPDEKAAKQAKQALASEEQPDSPEQTDLRPKKEETLPTPPKRTRRERITFTTLHPEVPKEQRHDFHITDDALGHGTPGEKFAANVKAIRCLKRIEAEERLATPEEQEILSRYVGWGGLADCFDERHSKYQELRSLLDSEEYAAARASSLTAFYTPPVVIRGIYKALSQMGFTQGNILEPSCGTGNFLGLLPPDMAGSKAYGVELDSISGRIAGQLYQNASISVNGFETVQMPDSFFDVAVGNVPFGDFKVVDKRYDKHHWLIHDYFFGNEYAA